jgi:hypothetical protein
LVDSSIPPPFLSAFSSSLPSKSAKEGTDDGFRHRAILLQARHLGDERSKLFARQVESEFVSVEHVAVSVPCTLSLCNGAGVIVPELIVQFDRSRETASAKAKRFGGLDIKTGEYQTFLMTNRVVGVPS